MIGRRRGKPGRASERDATAAFADGEQPFTLTRRGYDMAEVAAFVSSLSADMTTLNPADLRRIEFTVARRGYDKAEVLAYLNRIAVEVEAELEEARAAARIQRLQHLDPALASSLDEIEPVGAADEAPPSHAAPAAETAPSVVEPPTPTPNAPVTEVVIYETPGHDSPPEPAVVQSEPGREVLWLSPEEFAEGASVTAPTPPRPNHESEPTPVAEVRAPAATEAIDPDPQPTVADASSQIGDLLRAAHDTALRLRSQAEADVRSTIDAARSEIEERTKTQRRELAEARSTAEAQHARVIHQAELVAIETRNAAERDAAAMRAAAAAVMTQARSEVEAVKALARHNLGEIETSRHLSLEQAREMLTLGRGMLSTVVDLDRECERRLARTHALIEASEATTS